MTDFNFGPARHGETLVFGAQRPGYRSKQVGASDVGAWIGFMRRQGIERIVCLLDDSQLAYYDDLLGAYRSEFGAEAVLSTPVPDFTLATQDHLAEIFAFLHRSEEMGCPSVIHCSGGIGRTGHALAAWLAHRYGLEPTQAIEAVKQSGATRDPRESGDNAGLDKLLAWARSSGPGAAT